MILFCRRAVLTIACATCPSVSWAQGPVEPSPPTPSAPPGSVAYDASRVVAENLAQLAVQLVRTVEQPTIDDFKIASIVLGQAIELDPDNEAFVRLRLGALRAAKEDEEIGRELARLVRLRPDDTAAQLRLISSRLNRLQEIEARLAAYGNLLGPAGEDIDASVRSRLAFDAAMLRREIGDEPGFLSLLSRSLQLDQTNKQAALMATTLFLARSDDPESRFEMRVQLILADPFDPTSHEALSRELLANGAFTGARRFFEIARSLRVKRQQRMSQELLSEYLTVVWGHEGGEAFLDRLAEEEASMLFMIDSRRRQLETAGEDPADVPNFAPDPVVERLRVVMASALRRDEEGARLLERLASSQAEALSLAREDGQFTPEQLSEASVVMAIEQIGLRAWTGYDVDAASEALDAIAAAAGDELRPEAVSRYRALFAAHRGETEQAQRVLLPLAEEGDSLARLGLGISAEAAEDTVGAVRHYALAVRSAPGTDRGLWAAERLRDLLGASIKPDPLAVRLDALASEAPRQLERMVADPSEYLTMRVSYSSDELDALTSPYVEVELKNTGILPLGLGDAQSIPARMLVAPRLTINGAAVNEGFGPEVGSFAHKVRLRPGESVRETVWLGGGRLGSILETTAPLAASLRVQAIQGFFYSEERGAYNADPFSVTANSGVIWRRPAETSPSLESIIERLGSQDASTHARALFDAQWFLLTPLDAPRITSRPRSALRDDRWAVRFARHARAGAHAADDTGVLARRGDGRHR